jgi:hypothetical protein
MSDQHDWSIDQLPSDVDGIVDVVEDAILFTTAGGVAVPAKIDGPGSKSCRQCR